MKTLSYEQISSCLLWHTQKVVYLNNQQRNHLSCQLCHRSRTQETLTVSPDLRRQTHQLLVDACTCLGAQDVTNVGSSLESLSVQSAYQPVVDKLPWCQHAPHKTQSCNLSSNETLHKLLSWCIMTEGNH